MTHRNRPAGPLVSPPPAPQRPAGPGFTREDIERGTLKPSPPKATPRSKTPPRPR